MDQKLRLKARISTFTISQKTSTIGKAYLNAGKIQVVSDKKNTNRNKTLLQYGDDTNEEGLPQIGKKYTNPQISMSKLPKMGSLVGKSKPSSMLELGYGNSAFDNKI